MTPLHWAAEWNSPDVAEILIRSGADIHVKDNVSFTPMRILELSISL